MNDLEQFIDLRQTESDPELIAIALALRHIRVLIQHSGSDTWRPDDDSALHPHHLEAFLARAMERIWKDMGIAQEWRLLQLLLSLLKEAWERGRTLFQEDLDQAKGKEYLDYFSTIDIAVGGYAYLSASRVYPDNPALPIWSINGYMVARHEHFRFERKDILCEEE